MASSKRSLVLKRSHKTGEIDVRRANEFSRRGTSYNPNYELHYVGTNRKQVCRCTLPSRHYERIIAVASEETHLNASLMLYMSRHGLESCTIASFERYKQHRKTAWREAGVDVNTFHYMNDEKNKVCRCSQPTGHSTGVPRNPEIIEQCAEFFILHPDAVTCRKSQWRRVEGDSPPVYSPPATSFSHRRSSQSPILQASTISPKSPQNAFVYDSPSAHGFLREWSPRGIVSPEMKMRSRAEPLKSTHAQSPSSGIRGELDIPEDVWRATRSSVRIQHQSSSVTTTPLGSGLPQHLELSPQYDQSAPDRLPERASISTCWSNVQRGAGTNEEDGYRNNSRVGSTYIADVPSYSPVNCNHTYTEQRNNHSNSYELGVQPGSVLNNAGFELHAEPIVELPSTLAAMNLDSAASYGTRYHKPTLDILENRNFDTVSELPGKQNAACVSPGSSCPPTLARPLPRLSSYFGQLSEEVRLPDQEEFLLRHVVVSSHINLPPSADCSTCDDSSQHGQRLVVMAPECKHSFHETCLLEHFRAFDQPVGNCPICHVVLCNRTLVDRIHSDRYAIFGSQFTRLRCEVSIEFPQYNEVVKCASEEEVAAAHLRLIKGYVAVHLEEVFSIWEMNFVEPDWFMAIVRPVVKLFQAWSLPHRQSRYFSEHETFLKLMAWAELMRLINNRLEASLHTQQGRAAAFPQLSGLHRKFTLARERYDEERLSWASSQPRGSECNVIARDVLEIALRTSSLGSRL